jgi:hypothetical protein
MSIKKNSKQANTVAASISLLEILSLSLLIFIVFTAYS